MKKQKKKSEDGGKFLPRILHFFANTTLCVLASVFLVLFLIHSDNREIPSLEKDVVENVDDVTSSQIGELEGMFSKLAGEINNHDNRFKELEFKIEENNVAIDRFNKDKEELENKLEGIAAEIGALSSRLDEELASVAESCSIGKEDLTKAIKEDLEETLGAIEKKMKRMEKNLNEIVEEMSKVVEPEAMSQNEADNGEENGKKKGKSSKKQEAEEVETPKEEVVPDEEVPVKKVKKGKKASKKASKKAVVEETPEEIVHEEEITEKIEEVDDEL